MLTGSTMIGGSSISLFIALISEEGGASQERRDLSSLSRFMVRNLLDLRDCLDVEGVGVSSGDELPLARLLEESVTDFARSRFACF
jgi:hypothetical protein